MKLKLRKTEEYEFEDKRYHYTDGRMTPRINSKDNTITIRKVKDSWTRDEVIALLKKEYIVLEEISNSKPPDTLLLGKWIEDNI